MTRKLSAIQNWCRRSIRPYLVIISLLIFMIVLLIVLIYYARRIIPAVLSIFVSIICLIFLVVIFITHYLETKDFWLRIYPFDNKTTIDVIEKVMISQKLNYRKLSCSGQIKKFVLKYEEIFDIEDSEISIKVNEEVSGGSIVYLGPIRRDNVMVIENLKQSLDNAFRPKVVSY